MSKVDGYYVQFGFFCTECQQDKKGEVGYPYFFDEETIAYMCRDCVTLMEKKK